MRVAKYNDLSILLTLDEEGEFADGIYGSVRSGKIIAIVNDTDDAAILFDSVTSGVLSAHIISKRSFRGKKLKDFSYEAVRYMVDTGYLKNLILFVRDKDKRLKMFLALFKLKPTVTVGEYVMYNVDSQAILNWR
jgi:hypothetical protein